VVKDWQNLVGSIKRHECHALAWVQQVHKPADPWEITFCTN
jgi:hypothetical protein